MTYYSQKDQRWANERLGTCSDTIKQSGCKITCLASFAGITPSEVNKRIPYVSGCLTNDETAAKALGLSFDGKTTVKPNHDCIAETDHYKTKGVPQHFFILLADGRCVNPLDLNPVPKKNPYKIVSYRLFKPLIKEETMEKSFVEAIEKLVGKDYGDNLNEKEQVDAARKLQDVKEKLAWASSTEQTNKRLLENNAELTKKLGLVSTEAANLRLALEAEKALNEGNAETTKAWDALIFFVKTVMKSVK